MFLVQCDKRRYGKLLEDLKNNYTRGVNGYPKDMVTAFKMINEFKNWQPTKPADVTGTAFASRRKNPNQNSSTDWHKDATCHHCKKKGHIRTNCPVLKDEENTAQKTSDSADNPGSDNK